MEEYNKGYIKGYKEGYKQAIKDIRSKLNGLEPKVSLPAKKKPRRTLDNLKERKVEFAESIAEHREFLLEEFGSKVTPDQLNKFYLYWIEHNNNGWVMRFEKQTTFNTKLRLITWFRNVKDNEKDREEGLNDRKRNIIESHIRGTKENDSQVLKF